MSESIKKILVVDDSALMRRVLCDIINSDRRFQVISTANDGVEALDLLSRNTYDAVVLDVNMPRMSGLELLKQLQKFHISARVMMASTDTREGAQTTLDALELGAIDFIHKPNRSFECKDAQFVFTFLNTLYAVSSGNVSRIHKNRSVRPDDNKILEFMKKHCTNHSGEKIVAIASSTGGPKALQSIIPFLPKELNAPVVIVQHMPKGFTASLADRLNSLSKITVREAKEGEELQAGVVYVAMGGQHLNVIQTPKGSNLIHYSDEAPREGVKPCANYMYESLRHSSYSQVVCVVLTGMGADGTAGIQTLKEQKTIHVIAQNQDSCVVYGMPKSVVNAGLSDQTVDLEQIAQEIILHIGVNK